MNTAVAAVESAAAPVPTLTTARLPVARSVPPPASDVAVTVAARYPANVNRVVNEWIDPCMFNLPPRSNDQSFDNRSRVSRIERTAPVAADRFRFERASAMTAHAP